MRRISCNRESVALALFIAFVTSAVAGILYFTQPLTSNEDLDKELMDAVKASVSPSDIKTVLHSQNLAESVVNLQLFTACRAITDCSVRTAMGFAPGDVPSQSKFVVSVHVEAEVEPAWSEMPISQCSTVWKPKRSTWTIQMPDVSNPDELSTIAGDFAELDDLPRFEGRDSVLNIVRSIRKGILNAISLQRRPTNLSKEECRTGRALLST